VFAELDRRMVVKRLRDGRQAKAATGKHATGSYTYGFHGQGKGRDRDAAPLDAEQQTIGVIKELRTAGLSYRAIITELESRGLRPRPAEHWSPSAVRNIVLRAS
jgi:DNA invertase Pin-like site-specific DNA recombinase